MYKLFVFVLSFWLSTQMPSVLAENDRPIVGVLAQDTNEFLLSHYPDKNHISYVASAYVKFIEGAGGRVVPIQINRPRSYYENLLNFLDGVILTGGTAFLIKRKGYTEAAEHIYDIATEINDKGVYFPLWGVCLGFQTFLYISNNFTEYRTPCKGFDHQLPLEFTAGYETSRLFHNAPANIINILKTENVTPNYHKKCATVDWMAASGFNKTWKILSVNHDEDGLEFVSTIEHVKYPFYGLQFHPEKNLYQFARSRKNISHTAHAVEYAQYFADFLLSEARKSTNEFPNSTIEDDMLIYNYVPEYTGKFGYYSSQSYLFSSDDG